MRYSCLYYEVLVVYKVALGTLPDRSRLHVTSSLIIFGLIFAAGNQISALAASKPEPKTHLLRNKGSIAMKQVTLSRLFDQKSGYICFTRFHS